MQITTKKIRESGVRVTSVVDTDAALVFDSDNDETGVVLKFRCNGKWCYQGLHWSCRGGRAKYYRTLVALYRFLRRNSITNRTLRFIAWGENRRKHDGFAIG